MNSRQVGAERLLAPGDVAAMLGVTPRAVEAWRGRRVGPAYVRVGRVIRYRRADVEAWVASRTESGGGLVSAEPAGEPGGRAA